MIGRSAVTRSDLMRLSHSWTPKLNILEILTHFWPASEPCRQASITDMGLYVSCACPTFPYLATLWIWRHEHAKLSHSTLSNLGTISLKSRTLRAKMSYSWRGSIKRPDLPTGYRYRTESFSVDSNVIGRSTCAVTRTDLIRVSHSWTPKLNILDILTHFWPASEPCRQATITDMDFMFPVPALPSLT